MMRYHKEESEELLAEERARAVLERRDRYRGTIHITTPVVADDGLRRKWFGMPPTKIAIKRQGGTVTF